MFYLIEKQNGRSQISQFIAAYLTTHFPQIIYSSLADTNLIAKNQINVYFIIDMMPRYHEACLALAKDIRHHDKSGHVIYISKFIDYRQLYQTRVAFLEVIPYDHTMTIKLTECIDYIISHLL